MVRMGASSWLAVQGIHELKKGNMRRSCHRRPLPRPQGQRTTNAPPFCADLFNPRNLPYGFHSLRLQRLGAGFPAVLDINLSQEDAQTWLSFLSEGLYLGSHTRCAATVPCRVTLLGSSVCLQQSTRQAGQADCSALELLPAPGPSWCNW